MALFNKIMFPLDLSDVSIKIVPYVVEMVGKYNAELHVVHATNINRLYVSPGMSATYIDEIEPGIEAEAEKNTSAFINSYFKNTTVIQKILAGRPGPEIIRYAEEVGVDLIIMGHSSTGIARAVFGSVAGYVVKYSHAPVLIISPGILENKLQARKQSKKKESLF